MEPVLSQNLVESVRSGESRRLPDQVLAEGANVIAGLLADGWRLEAAGDDGLVFGHTASLYVARLAQNWIAYGEFVALARNLDNPHLPYFQRWETDGALSLAVVERLVAIDLESHLWQEINIAAALAHALADSRPMRFAITGVPSPDLLAAAEALGNGAHARYYALDLGRENILLRPTTGEPVFNDPWSEWGE